MAIVLIGLSHHSSPVTVRERFAFSEARIPAVLELLRQANIVEEAVILSTCNRVEIYAATSLPPREAFLALKEFLVKCHDYRDPLTDELYSLAEPQSLQHLFKVAAGLDSMVLGETEILGQLKKATSSRCNTATRAAASTRLFQRAFNVAKQIRTETNIQRGSVSVGSVAVELAEKIFSTLQDREIMIIGAGDTGEKTARALLSRGARHILVSNRSHEKAVALAAELGGRAVRSKPGPRNSRRSTSPSAALPRPISSLIAPNSIPSCGSAAIVPCCSSTSRCHAISSLRSTSWRTCTSITSTICKASQTTTSSSAKKKSSIASASSGKKSKLSSVTAPAILRAALAAPPSRQNKSRLS